MSTADLAAWGSFFMTIVTALAGTFAYITSKVKRDIRQLRRFAVDSARWQFQAQLRAAAGGVELPPPPRPPWEEDEDDADEQTDEWADEEDRGDRDDEPAPARPRRSRHAADDAAETTG